MNTRTKGSAIVALTTSIVLFGNTIASGQTVLRVDIEHGSTSGTGSGWGSDAFKYLQDALAVAAANEPNPYDIWVAQGTYLPDQGQTIPPPQLVNPRELSFHLRNNVELYGGFVGNEQNRFERDPETNLTILSGNIGDTEDDSDNSYHVVQAINVDDSAMLNGFVVRDGRAFGDPQDVANRRGGGIFVLDATPYIIRCQITQNSAPRGGGMYVNNPSDSANPGPTVINSVLSYNESTSRGGGMKTSNLTLVNSLVHSNLARTYGGGVWVLQADEANFKIVNWDI